MTESTPANVSGAALLDQFVAHLETLRDMGAQANPDRRSLQQRFLVLQQLYQQNLLPTLMASDGSERWVSYQTEINRALRLLGMDVTFLQSAKNSLTQQQRQAQMQQRLKTLLEFSTGLQTELQRHDSNAPIDEA